MSELRPGEVLAERYRIDERIGAGSTAIVYRAHDLEDDSEVAVKLLDPELARDPEVVAAFQREARLGASVQHRNVVEVYAVGDDAARHFLVMGLLEKTRLDHLLSQKGALPLKRFYKLSLQI